MEMGWTTQGLSATKPWSYEEMRRKQEGIPGRGDENGTAYSGNNKRNV